MRTVDVWRAIQRAGGTVVGAAVDHRTRLASALIEARDGRRAHSAGADLRHALIRCAEQLEIPLEVAA